MKLNPDRPGRPLVRYPGAKYRNAAQIISLIPEAHDTYIEPYAGSLAVLLNKMRSPIEAANDMNRDLIQMMEIVRTRTEEFVHHVYWTPWSLAEWELSFKRSDDPLEQARRTYVRLWMSMFPYGRSPGWRRQTKLSRGKDGKKKMVPAAVSFMPTDPILQIAERLRGVELDCMPALDFIQRYDYDRAFFYVDPPYLSDTRVNKRINAYEHEMFDEDSHRELAVVLNNIEGMVIISGYAHPLYDEELYPDWVRVDFNYRTNGSDTAVESVWISPRTWAALEEERAAAEREALPLLAMMRG